MKTPSQVRNTRKWAKLSEYMRKYYPFCYNPFGNHEETRLADDVHHIRSIKNYPELAYDKKNLVTLCRSCHDKITKLENKKEYVYFLFDRPQPRINGMGVQKSVGDDETKIDRLLNIFIRNDLGGGEIKLICRRNPDHYQKVYCKRLNAHLETFCGCCDDRVHV